MKRGWIAFFLFSLTAINYVDRLTLALGAKPISREFHLSPIALGYLFSSYLWAYALMSIPMGFLVDRFGAKRVAASGIALWSAATIMTGAAASYAMAMASRIIMGGGEATTNPAGARIIREWFPASERGTVNAIFNAGAFAGPALSALVIGYLMQRIGWRAGFFAAGAFGFVWLLAWLIWYAPPERVRWLGARERERIVAERGMPSAGLRDRSGAAGLLSLLGTKTVWGLVLIGGADAYCSYLFLSWLPSYLQTTKHLNLATTGVYTAIPYATALVISLSVGQISDRLLKNKEVTAGHRRYVIALSSLIAAGLIAAVPFVTSVPLLLGMIAVAIGCLATNTAQVFALTSDLLPNAKYLGKVMSVEVAGANVLGFFSPIVTGYLIAFTRNFNAAFVTTGMMMLVGCTSALVLANRPIVVADPEERETLAAD